MGVTPKLCIWHTSAASEQGRGRGTCGLGLLTQVGDTGDCFGHNLAVVRDKRKHGLGFLQGILRGGRGGTWCLER